MKKKNLWWLLIFLLPVVVKLLIGEWANIPTPSMRPTLQPGDWIWYEKYSYGAVAPRRIAEIPLLNLLCLFPTIWKNDQKRDWGYHRAFGWRNPERMDVVVFRNPKNLEQLLVKRIVGLPGDTLSISYGEVHINGKVIEEKGRREYCFFDSGIEFPFTQKEKWTSMTYGPLIVPTAKNEDEAAFFVLGDARGNSIDSRFIGFVPFRNIIGKVSRVLYSPNNYKGEQKKLFRIIE